MTRKGNPKFFKILFSLTILTVVLFIYLLFLTLYQNRIFPGVRVADMDFSGKTPAVAHRLILTQFHNRATKPIVFYSKGQTYTLDLQSGEPRINAEELISSAYHLGRSGNFFQNLKDQTVALALGTNIIPEVSFRRTDLLNRQMSLINQKVGNNPVDAEIQLGETITIISSQNGLALDDQALTEEVMRYLRFAGPLPKNLPLKSTPPAFTTADARRYQKILEKVKNAPLKLRHQQDVFTLDQSTLFRLLNFKDTKSNLASVKVDGQTFTVEKITAGEISLAAAEAVIDEGKLAGLLKEFTNRVNQEARDAKFTVGTGSFGQIKVREFQPAREGRRLDLKKTAELIESSLSDGQAADINLPVVVTPPKVTTDSINNFGIKELLGEGISHFRGSIENRIFNVGLAASRIHGVLVPKDQTFSFNDTVGEISGATGYKQAYVIKSGRTILDDGGGVCQVSTTLFRAILKAGLPVTQRVAHAYRVGYYEQNFPPGLDATVYAPSVDLKFKNDTPGSILIQASVVGTSLFIDLYGTSDGRVSTLSTSVVTNQTPPPPELRQDDPTLPRGTIKQVDWAAWGANVVFKRVVRRNGETIINESWPSNYRPWQAVFLVGIKD